ncbi:hypothetical protein BSNK01_06850 [Bacillaceae bacterium]
MSEQTFTQEQVNEMIENAKKEWIEKELNPVIVERDELMKYKPKELSDEEKAIQAKQQELFVKEVELTLKEHDLAEWKEFFNVSTIDELKVKIDKFKKILNEKRIENSYKPENHRSTDQYSKYEQEKNTVGMISTKLAKIFK